jgi:hypothetical protein
MDDIEDILAMKEDKKPITLENLFNMVEEVMEEDEENIEETSTMAGGSIHTGVGTGARRGPLKGASGLDPAKRDPWKSGKKKRRKGRRIYIPD